VPRRFPRVGPLLILAAIVLWFAALLVHHARAKAIWHDEVYTILEAALPVATLWRASIDGLDLSPPLNSILTHVVRTVAGAGPVAMRLVPIVALLIAAALIFEIVRRRSNVIMAIAAALALYLSVAWQYALEARGYSLTVACYALAMFGWSEAAAGRHRRRNWAVMAIAIAAGAWAHYYAVLIAAPIVAGEIVRQVLRRRIEWMPWIALVAAGVLCLPLGILVSAGAPQRHTFWARPSSFGISGVYEFLAGDVTISAIAVTLLIALAVLEIVRRVSARTWPRQLPAYEVAAGIVCVALPAMTAVLGYLAHAFDRRYAVFGVFGVVLAGTLAIWSVLPKNRLGDVVLVAALGVTFTTYSVRTFREPTPWPHPYLHRPVLADWLHGDDPLVITCGVDYLALWYYAPPAARARAIYIADPARQLRDTGTDTSDRGYLALARWTPVPAVPLADYITTHRRFWLYSCGRSWIEDSLEASGATLTERNAELDKSGTLFEVNR